MKQFILNLLAATVVAICLNGCGGSDNFTVTATVDGLGTQNIRVAYRSGGRLHTLTTTALDGKLSFSGNSEQPTLIQLYTGSRALIGSLVAKNGEAVELELKLNEPGFMIAKGDKASEQLAKFITDNAEAINQGNYDTVNEAVEKYVSGNLSAPAAPYIILTQYNPELDPAMADSMLSMINEKVRPANDVIAGYRETLSPGADTLKNLPALRLYTTGDSTTEIKPTGKRGVFLAFTGARNQIHHDSIVSRLNKLHKEHGKQVRVAEISIVADTTDWKLQIKEIEPQYTRCWEPGGVASPALKGIKVKRTPWFIAADSTGTVIYSGRSIDDAVNGLTK